MSTDIFTKRGITPPTEPGGHVARAQGFERYEGADWRERRERLRAIDPRYGAGHPDPEAAYLDARNKVLDRMLGPRSTAAREYAGPEYDDSYLEIEPFAPIRLRRSHKTQARLHFDSTGQAPDDVLEALAALDPAKVAQKAWVGWLSSALAVDGWALPRHAALAGDDDPLTQIRPDDEVNMGKGPAKYVYTPGRTAKRLGTNPLARKLPAWDDPRALFVFVMEGTLKMCSVVEAGYPAFDAGSITLWGGGDHEVELHADGASSRFVSEIERFAGSHLVGRPVAVVVDSDWVENDDVRWQSNKVVNVLRRAGVGRVVACAPPEGEPLEDGTREKLGVDDWIGKSSEWLDREYGPPRRDFLDLVFPQVTDEAPELEEAVLSMPHRGDRLANAVKVARVLSAQASATGRVAWRREDVAKLAGVGERTAYRVLKDLGEVDLLTELAPERFDPRRRTTEPAALRLAAPLIRPSRVRTLRDWLVSD